MRKRFGNLEKRPLHVMGHCRFSRWPSNMDQAWEIFQTTIDDLQQDFKIKTHAFVMMGNHYHWLCTPDDENDLELFDWFHELINCRFLKYFGPSSEDLYTMEQKPKIVTIKNFPQYQATYRYVYNNPFSAKLIGCPFEYPYSTLPFILGKRGLLFDVIDNMGTIFSPTIIRCWLSGEMDLWAQ